MSVVRHFELVSGSSAKFWEITHDDVEVTVRYGRLGTDGTHNSKTFGTEAAASAHVTKLITEKTRKGYAETGPATGPTVPAAAAPASASPASAAPAPVAAVAAAPVDEDAFVVPLAWHRLRHPRRGGAGVTALPPSPGAAAAATALVDALPGYVGKVLAHRNTDADLARAGQAWLAGDPAAGPVGAAAVAGAANHAYNSRDRDKMVAFADHWLADRGVVFAASAAFELFALISGDRSYGRGDVSPLRHRGPHEKRPSWAPDAQLIIAARVRAALAGCPEAEYAAAVDMLEGYRSDLYQRVAASFLAPTRQDWVDDDCAAVAVAGDEYLAAVLLTAAGSVEQLDVLADHAQAYLVVRSAAMVNSVVEGVGPASLGLLLRWLDRDWSDADSRRRVLSAITVLPTDSAMQALIDRIDEKYVQPAMLDMAAAFPARALRLLAANDGKRLVADLLRAHVLAHPQTVARLLPELPEATARRVQAIVTAAASVVEAPTEALPPILVDPPWAHRRTTAKAIVVPGLSCADPATVEWAPGERDIWRAVTVYAGGRRDSSWVSLADRMRAGKEYWWEPIGFFTQAPEDLARPLLATWRVTETWDTANWLRVTAARFELDALPLITEAARRSPSNAVPALLPYVSVEVATLMADWLGRLKSVRPVVLAWLARHPARAARALVPAAVGPAGAPRRQAEQALRAIAGAGHDKAVRSAAEEYGPEAGAAVEHLLATDPLTVLPARIPAVPAWAAPAMLPPVQLRNGAGALPPASVTHLVTALALSRPGEPYAGVAVIKQACDPDSLAEFGWGLFQRWQTTGANNKESWALDVLGLIGDDETVRRLTPVIQAWPGEGGHVRAVTGVEVLAAIGTDVALMHLHGIAQRAKFKGLKAAANQKMDEVAEGLGLSAEQLADRLVPDFGLDPDGSLTLDYGPRQFIVGFDEQLKPYVADPDGKRRKDLPKPGVNDDAELAPAAHKRFAALKKDVRTVATDQIRRLERAMVSQRRWTGTEFRELFVAHPLLWHIVRRLVWGVHDGDGAIAGALRVAEDRSLADANDDPFTLPDDASVGVAHPLHLGPALATWAEVFADYEILQPFPQLGRDVHTLTEEETAATSLRRFEGRTVPTGRVIGLERRGWLREAPQDGGVQGRIEKSLPGGLTVVVDLDPGIAVGDLTIFPEQELEAIFVHDGSGGGWRQEGRLALGRLDPVTVSEIVRELNEVTA